MRFGVQIPARAEIWFEISVSSAQYKMYCIVLYLYIYIALLAVQTNQKRSQFESLREKKAVLREQKDAIGSPVNKVDGVEGRS